MTTSRTETLNTPQTRKILALKKTYLENPTPDQLTEWEEQVNRYQRVIDDAVASDLISQPKYNLCLEFIMEQKQQIQTFKSQEAKLDEQTQLQNLLEANKTYDENPTPANLSSWMNWLHVCRETRDQKYIQPPLERPENPSPLPSFEHSVYEQGQKIKTPKNKTIAALLGIQGQICFQQPTSPAPLNTANIIQASNHKKITEKLLTLRDNTTTDSSNVFREQKGACFFAKSPNVMNALLFFRGPNEAPEGEKAPSSIMRPAAPNG